jgi:hypothetical protein
MRLVKVCYVVALAALVLLMVHPDRSEAQLPPGFNPGMNVSMPMMDVMMGMQMGMSLSGGFVGMGGIGGMMGGGMGMGGMGMMGMGRAASRTFRLSPSSTSAPKSLVAIMGQSRAPRSITSSTRQ